MTAVRWLLWRIRAWRHLHRQGFSPDAWYYAGALREYFNDGYSPLNAVVSDIGCE